MTSHPSNLVHHLPASEQKQQLKQQLAELRADTLALFEDLDAETFCRQAHAEFSPAGWHLGHIGFIEAHWLLERCAGQPPLAPASRCLFAADGLPKNRRTKLPTLAETRDYLDTIRVQVLRYLEVAPLAEQAWLWYWMMQHEAQHSETITWVIALQRQRWSLTGHRPSPWVAPLSSGHSSSGSRRTLEADMVLVEAGSSQQGNDAIDALDNERSRHPVHLESYWIDRYPVTQRQYQAFMAAGGYSDSRWWSPEGWVWLQTNPVSRPLYWSAADDQPVCGVSWYEADAYTRFAGKRLPTEAEWEKAASWAPAAATCRPYPWGEAEPTAQRCNFNHNVGQTTPVDRYAAGQSAYGCYDLLGNVWEWTATWFHPYPHFVSYPYAGYSTPYFDNQHRVLKGGSWATRPAVLRCAFRNWYHPGVRQHFAGFRCARS